ncbi:MAG: hypothetical protein K9M57_07830 [Phycisphaerae bacterium]|nr:hypothetical protein [Phycisphaerae bacterium]
MSTGQIDPHTLKVLEYNQILQILSSYASSSLGQKIALQLFPSVDRGWIADRLSETTEMKELIQTGHRIPLAGLKDISDLIKSHGSEQSVLEPDELLDIRDTLAVSGQLKKFLADIQNTPIPHLKKLSGQLEDYQDIIDEISRCILGDQGVQDSASEKLKSIRREINMLQDKVQQEFRAVTSSSQMKNALANDSIMMRNGRVVVLVKSNYRQRVRGMVLDRSKTGNALYIEPYAMAELSNQLESAHYDEKREIERILWELTRIVINQRDDIKLSIKILTFIDLIYAKARFSIAYKMGAPSVNTSSSMNLQDARHPLLINLFSQQGHCQPDQAIKEVIPIDVRLGDDFDLLILTGPNTGGKTVTLKTIGLLILMAQTGLHIPARPDSDVPVYRQIYADIGDEQSLQQSLSTFSAHMRQIVQIIKRSNDTTLVLLDELGSGTDPTEGAALSTSILTELHTKNAHAVATTHLGQLKNFAYSTDRVENGSVQFDIETLQPTYRLLIGTPGSSNALVIAKKLGMPEEIIASATHILAEKHDGSAELINQVQATRESAEHKRKEADRLLESAKGIQHLAVERLDRAGQEQAELMNRANQEIDREMRKIRSVTNEFVRHMQSAPKPWSDKCLEFSKTIERTAASTPLAQRQAAFIETIHTGDTVYVIPFKKEALVQRIRRKKSKMMVLIDGMQVDVSFTDIWRIE